MLRSTNFLTAEWRKLAIVNYAIDGNLLQPFLPAHTELDSWKGKHYVSLVGFMFLNTKLKSLKIPFHSNFEEVNLRFYVKHANSEISKRGVTFIKEFVPKPALSFIANTVYKENYETVPMQHCWQENKHSIDVAYKWKKKDWHSFSIKAENMERSIEEGSEEEFITEHYWGYTRVNERSTSEYEVAHPRWHVYPVRSYQIDVDFATVYGEQFSFLKEAKPVSVFLAEGSEIVVKEGRKIY